MKLPKHVNATIEHQPHSINYETVEQYLASECQPVSTDADRAEMLRTGEVWAIQWYPVTPVGFCYVAAATLERALELANEGEEK